MFQILRRLGYQVEQNYGRRTLRTLVEIDQGTLQGNLEPLPDDGAFVSFKGIPYAKPPVGPLRFKAPQPPDKWQGVRDATKHNNVSIQREFTKKVIGDEDCLYLNVYTPNVEGNTDKKYPVMVFVYGGSFMMGSGNSDMYGPEYLVANDVVLVTFNYRLEVMGFLCMENEEIPGNAGIKDQVAVLKWIRDNISQFGGDPENVTIFGESAGAASVTYHMFSPQTRGLFHKVIAQSSVCACHLNIAINPLKRAFQLGEFLGLPCKDPKELMAYLKRIPAEKTVGISNQIITLDEKIRESGSPFRPVVEKSYDNEDPYITELPSALLKKGEYSDVPLMAGYNDGEGIYLVSKNFSKSQLNTHHEQLIPADIISKISLEEARELGKRIKEFYFGNELISKDNIESLVKLRSDKHWGHPTYAFAKRYASKSKSSVFFYRFSCDSEINFGKKFFGENLKGASHTDELFYLFKSNLSKYSADVKTEVGRMIARTTKLWTNMAKYGNPTPLRDDLITAEWKPIAKNEFNFMDIGEKLTSSVNPDHDRHVFWESIYSEMKTH